MKPSKPYKKGKTVLFNPGGLSSNNPNTNPYNPYALNNPNEVLTETDKLTFYHENSMYSKTLLWAVSNQRKRVVEMLLFGNES